MKTFLKFSIFALAIVLFLACEKITEISLNKNELYLVPGETETLIATVYPTDAYHKKVDWTSRNPAVAAVTDNGLVTAISSGKTIITVSSQNGKKTAICSITVDYRAKWVGVYECEVCSYISHDPPNSSIPPYNSDTTYHKAIVDVTAIDDSILHIKQREIVDRNGFGLQNYVKVSDRGEFKYVEYRLNINGHFYKDSLYASYFNPIAKTTNQHFKYYGKKQK